MSKTKKCECGNELKDKSHDICETCQIEYNAYAASNLYEKMFGKKITE